MSLKALFDKLDAMDPGSLLIDHLDGYRDALVVHNEYQASALRVCVETAKWSASQNPQIAERYCRELDWTPSDLAAMMLMQCATVSLTSGEFISSAGVLTHQGQGFRFVWDSCTRALLTSGRIDAEIADIERSELQAEIDETAPSILGSAFE